MRYGKVAIHYKAPEELLHHVDVGIKEKSTNLIKGTTLGGNRDVSRSSDIAWIGDKDLREMFLGFAHRANYDAQWYSNSPNVNIFSTHCIRTKGISILGIMIKDHLQYQKEDICR